MKLITRFLPHLGIAALVVIAALSAGLALTRGKLANVRKDLTVEKALHQTDIANFKGAQAKANADWQAERARIQTENRRQNDEADRRADATRTDYAARVMRLPTAPANSGLSGTANLPGAGVPARSNGPGADSVLLARSDALICAANTARLSAAHEWAVKPATRPSDAR